jgi:hypothetical protein
MPNDILKDLITACVPAVNDALQGLPVGHTLPAHYTLFGKDGDGKPGYLTTLDERQFTDRLMQHPAAEMHRMFNPEDFAEKVHAVAIDFVRMMCSSHDEIEWLLVISEAWVSQMDLEGNDVAKKHEAIVYVAHQRSGETLVATQEMIRPAGQAASLYGDPTFSEDDRQTGAILQFFPAQRTEEALARDKELREQFEAARAKREAAQAKRDAKNARRASADEQGKKSS